MYDFCLGALNPINLQALEEPMQAVAADVELPEYRVNSYVSFINDDDHDD